MLHSTHRQKHLDCLLFLIVSMIGIYCLAPMITSRQGDKHTHHRRKQFDFNFDRSRKQYDLRIIVLTYQRAMSLQRLLNSLNDAEYYSDNIKIEVWIDRSEEGHVDNATADIGRHFTFKHGLCEIIFRQKHSGIYGQWLTSWKPLKNSSEIAVILEDDLTVSPFFYKYLKIVHGRYDRHPQVNGYALQGYSIKHHMNDSSMLEGPKGSFVFLYPVIGTWGFSPNTKHWIDFLSWFSAEYERSDVRPFVPENIASYWYLMLQRQGRQDSMWEIWHIYYSWLKQEYTLYSNFPEHAGLSTNWREVGLHYTSKEGPSNILLKEWKAEYDDLPAQPVMVGETRIGNKRAQNESNMSIDFANNSTITKTLTLALCGRGRRRSGDSNSSPYSSNRPTKNNS